PRRQRLTTGRPPVRGPGRHPHPATARTVPPPAHADRRRATRSPGRRAAPSPGPGSAVLDAGDGRAAGLATGAGPAGGAGTGRRPAVLADADLPVHHGHGQRRLPIAGHAADLLAVAVDLAVLHLHGLDRAPAGAGGRAARAAGAGRGLAAVHHADLAALVRHDHAARTPGNAAPTAARSWSRASGARASAPTCAPTGSRRSRGPAEHGRSPDPGVRPGT